ncbi:hypothetical protein ANCDUO_01979 [Ancylostoma duodenale]|uniref:Uncharacterized protein n=1 Tax=Ancylostoma duodenale TaxID=51022 RepID=A0A0C2H7Y0_9BILA|nr:hypothetical protein ANCDUO_01979 [Ancylostoma duodenale]
MRKKSAEPQCENVAGNEQAVSSDSTAPPPEKSIPVTRTRKRGTQQLTEATAGDEQVVSSAATAQVPEKSTPPIKTRKQATQQLNEAVAGDEQDVPSDSTAPPPEKSIPVTRTRKRGTQQTRTTSYTAVVVPGRTSCYAPVLSGRHGNRSKVRKAGLFPDLHMQSSVERNCG